MKTSSKMLLLVIILFSTHLLQLVPPTSATNTWTVDDDGPADFRTIQEAVNIANQGDTIFVRNGTYIENITVNKTLKLIGENRDGTIIDGNQTGSIIRINRTNNVSVTGFTIRNSGRERHLFETSGIFLYYSSGVLIERNKVVNNEAGVYFYVSSDNIVNDNLVTNNFFYGILMDYSLGPPKNVIRNNLLADNGFGIGLDTSFGHIISNNIVTNSSWNGIYIFSNSHNNTVTENTVIGARNGILLQESNGVTLEGNVISNNAVAGIQLLSSSFNNISGNLIKSNYDGVYFRDNSANNTFTLNQVSSNTIGVHLSSSQNNIFYHNNFINNSDSALIEESSPPQNLWDSDYPSGGNYWHDYTGVDIYSGPYQNITGNDGKGDIPYRIASLNLDRYPLMSPGTLPLRFHDITISNVTLSTNQVYMGEIVNITITVQNRGTFTENFTVTSSYDLDGNKYILETTNVNNLSPHSNATLKVTWKTQHAGAHRLRVYTSKFFGDIYPFDNTSSEVQVTVKTLDGISVFLSTLVAITIIIVVVALGFVLYYLKVRRSKQPQK